MSENILTKEEFLKEYQKDLQKDLQKKQEISQLKKEEEKEDNSVKYYNKGGKVKIRYESEGTFSIPDTLYFSDYLAKDVNDIIVCSDEDRLETAVTVLNSKVTSHEPVNVADMTLDEFFETLIAMKIQYKSNIYEYEWYCVDCQGDQENPEPKIKKIDLTKLNYKSLYAVNDEIQKELLITLKSMTDEQFLSLLQSRPEFTGQDLTQIKREDFVKQFVVKEPIIIPYEGKKYYFRFPRVADLINSKRMVEKLYTPKFKRVRNEVIPNGSKLNENISDKMFEKEERIKKLQAGKYKDVILYLKAMTFIGIDGQVIKDDKERISVFEKLPQLIIDKLEEYLKKVQYGVNEEIELVCECCGKTTRRYLQQELDFGKLLPTPNTNPDKQRGTALQDIFLGV